MSRHDDDFAAVSAPQLFWQFAVAATYQPSGADPLAISARLLEGDPGLNYDDRAGEEGVLRQAVIEVLVSEVATSHTDDRVTIGQDTWSVTAPGPERGGIRKLACVLAEPGELSARDFRIRPAG